MKKPLVFKVDIDPIPPRQINHDGSVEYTCVGCGARVFMTADDGFDFPACQDCRWPAARVCIEPTGAA